ncbi:CDGSH iron-sulfur domain-containing protein [Rapidithrix thailandica]|uniref:CDGSH iron-sulfur domain-containing protein n=1 Tax=Rapidithrix thailandica TaxID=413964 RepID=A0AAW9SBB8_9BACT
MLKQENQQQPGPWVYEMEPGQYAWCTCGKSNHGPFCDGSHKGSGYTPLSISLREKCTVTWCGCKKTDHAPFCDGSHCKK